MSVDFSLFAAQYFVTHLVVAVHILQRECKQSPLFGIIFCSFGTVVLFASRLIKLMPGGVTLLVKKNSFQHQIFYNLLILFL